MVVGVVERRQTLPILSNVLIKVEDNTVSLTGTDLEVELVATVLVDVSDAGEITVPARKLMDIFRELPEETQIEVGLEEQKLLIKCGRFRSSLSTLPSIEFPTIEKSDIEQEITIGGMELKTLIDRTGFAMAQQDVRYFLNGMLLEVQGDRISTVATDGHRLAFNTATVASSIEELLQVIIPRKGVIELQRLVGDVEKEVKLTLGKNHISAETGDFSLMSKLVDGKFPDYHKVIPRDGDKTIVADRLELRQALNRTSILSNEKFRGIRINLETGNVKLSANNPEQEEAEETVAVDYKGEPLEAGFNVGYLLDVLNVVDSDVVKVTLLDANSSALLEDPDNEESVFVVMPMKL
jgi:DNA polymerase-3 subunit beta